MAKKIILVALLFMLFQIKENISYATKSYTSFEDISFSQPGNKFLVDYTDDDYTEYTSKLGGSKFMGWNTHLVTNNAKVKFKVETEFSYYNNGDSSLSYVYKRKEKQVQTFDVSVSKQINSEIKGEYKKFKGGLSTVLKVNLDYKITTETQVEEEMKIELKPGTRMIMYYYGEGRINNGVARKYIFWFTNTTGGFETFKLTTYYPRIEILPIWLEKP